jgi:D-amino peptidase
MLCDMEGVSGIYTQEQAWRSEGRPELYAEGRRLMTLDVNAAAQAALAAGVDKLFVCDTHAGGGRNLLWNDVLGDSRILYEVPQGAWLMPSLDRTFDGLILLGHHARAGTQSAFLDHTWSGQDWFDFQINDLSVGEIGLEACYAGHWDVPLIMVQGDLAACEEAEALIPGVVTAPVKRGLARNRATGPAPELARKLTGERMARAIDKARRRELEPYKPELPMTIRFTGTTTAVIDRLAQKPRVRRLDGRTVETKLTRQCDILSWLVG